MCVRVTPTTTNLKVEGKPANSKLSFFLLLWNASAIARYVGVMVAVAHYQSTGAMGLILLIKTRCCKKALISFANQ